jgi:uncharacterized membrane protein
MVKRKEDQCYICTTLQRVYRPHKIRPPDKELVLTKISVAAQENPILDLFVIFLLCIIMAFYHLPCFNKNYQEN